MKARFNYSERKKLPPAMDLVPAFMEDLLLMSEEYDINRDDDIIVDTIGVDYYFVSGFINNQMYMDFPYIQREFLKNRYNRLDELREMGLYGGDYLASNDIDEYSERRIITLIYNGVKLGDEYCCEFIKYLYKTYFKREYNQLKRFHTINVPEIFSLSEDEDNEPTYTGVARIIVMSKLLNIQMHERCTMLYILLKKERKKYLEATEKSPTRSFNEEEFENNMDGIIKEVTEMSEERYKKLLKIQHKNTDFVRGILAQYGYSEYIIQDNNFYMSSPVSQLSATKTLLKEIFPKKEFSIDEIIEYANIRNIVLSYVSLYEQYEDEVENLFGSIEDDEYTPLFHSDKIKISENNKVVEEKRTPVIAPVSKGVDEQVYINEISKLRNKVVDMESHLKYLKEANNIDKRELQEKDILLNRMLGEREELIALREFVYKNYNSGDIEEEEKVSIDEMKSEIEEKKILIIGGHNNFLNKIKSNFPKWTLVRTDSFSTVDVSIVEKMDKVYFFTDYISHTTYYKFIDVVRNRKIPFGYIGSKNINQVIAQIYEDFN